MKVRKARGGTEITLEEPEVDLLRSVVSDLLVLLGDGEAAAADPLAAMVGLSEAERPTDPAVLRLFPDAYGDDDEAAAEFRRYTDADLRAGKRAHARTVLDTLRPGRLLLNRDEADAWLLTLNDLRLVLGTRLKVTQEEQDIGEDHPQYQGHVVYHWLGWVQDSVLGTLTARRSPRRGGD